MFARITLLALGLLLADPVVADGNPQTLPVCPYRTTLMHRMALQGVFDTSPSINTFMVNLIDGKLPQVRQQLSAMSAKDAVRWRQSALIIATYAQQPAIVEAMLHDGATVNGKGWIPGLKYSFINQAEAEITKDPNWATTNPDPTTGLEEAEVFTFQNSGFDGPALSVATECGDVSTMNVLLRQHPDIEAKQGARGGSPLEFAAATGDTTTVRLLLDHGASPDNALKVATALGRADIAKLLLDRGAAPCRANLAIRKPDTLVSIGRGKGFPDALLKRLACPAVAAER